MLLYMLIACHLLAVFIVASGIILTSVQSCQVSWGVAKQQQTALEVIQQLSTDHSSRFSISRLLHMLKEGVRVQVFQSRMTAPVKCCVWFKIVYPCCLYILPLGHRGQHCYRLSNLNRSTDINHHGRAWKQNKRNNTEQKNGRANLMTVDVCNPRINVF